ncbi:MAG: shikimate kinase [Bacteroidales bacterium]|nr:shikimate kinase [Bacteroidales bacterium]MCF8344764.1 shikimate kinase [Bacteroidales bacterium]MCF8352219.1 shikimate kinase [Bacteroidales bacterium]MCF8375692.1 shikimate kinase [Bacteroidales bacterium]MCF8400292.1 shikimate kinase [Bacteroidales bacterium]
MRVYLIGYMFSGKTTVGRKLARRFGYEFRDTDQVMEGRYKLSIPDFFNKYDEELFRELEHNTLIELSGLDNVVISTGGGTPCYHDNMSLMKEAGISVYLKMDVKSIHDRYKNSKKARPILDKIPESEIPEFFQDHLTEREQFYQQADITVKGENADIDLIYRSIRSLPRVQ